VVGDDELHLAVYDDLDRPGALLRLLPGHLSRDARARKRRKPDFEALLRLPGTLLAPGGTLVALGSGSGPLRGRGVTLPLDAQGRPNAQPWAFDLSVLHDGLRSRVGAAINVEGATVLGDQLLVLLRGVAGRQTNVSARVSIATLQSLLSGGAIAAWAIDWQPWILGTLDGVELGFTDAAALPGGAWVFSAVAEARDDSVADGPCAGSVIGVVSAAGSLVTMARVCGPNKVEGVDLRVTRDGIELCLVTDADDPAQPAGLWRALLSL